MGFSKGPSTRLSAGVDMGSNCWSLLGSSWSKAENSRGKIISPISSASGDLSENPPRERATDFKEQEILRAFRN